MSHGTEHGALARKSVQFEKLALSVGEQYLDGLTDADCPGGSVYKLQVLQGAAMLVCGVTAVAKLQEGSMLYHVLFQQLAAVTGNLEVSNDVALLLTESIGEEVGDYMDTPDNQKDLFDWFGCSE